MTENIKLKEKREVARGVPRDGWSHWKRAIVPPEDGDDEWRYLDDVEKFLDENGGKKCGIYEWKAVRNSHSIVLYIGSTCRGKRGPLKARVLEFCQKGGHKADFISDAVQRGFELHVRVKTAETKAKAEEMENNLLAKYDYAWNVRRNGYVRNMLPAGNFSILPTRS